MNLDKKTCPYCGKRLVLAPPSHEYFPESMGVSKNGVEFCAGSVRRLSYTLDPDPDHYREWILTEKLWFEQNKVHPRGGGYWRRTQHSLPLRCVSAEHIRRHIEKGGLSLYKWNIWFMCASCHKKLAVNFNPFRLMRMHVLLFLAAALLLVPGLLFFIAAIEVGRPELLWIPPVIYAGIIALIFLIVFGILKYIEGHFSNFAPVSEFDCLARLTTDLTASWEGASRRFFHECNVFQTEINGEEFSVFLIAKEKPLRFSVCGIDGEPQRLISLIKEKKSAGEPVTLNLSFEGKPAGSVKVIECMTGRRFT